MIEHKKEKLSYKKKYEFQSDGGSKVEIEIEAKIKDMDKKDLEYILHETAKCTRNFYLGLGRKIADSDQ